MFSKDQSELLFANPLTFSSVPLDVQQVLDEYVDEIKTCISLSVKFFEDSWSMRQIQYLFLCAIKKEKALLIKIWCKMIL